MNFLFWMGLFIFWVGVGFAAFAIYGEELAISVAIIFMGAGVMLLSLMVDPIDTKIDLKPPVKDCVMAVSQVTETMEEFCR